MSYGQRAHKNSHPGFFDGHFSDFHSEVENRNPKLQLTSNQQSSAFSSFKVLNRPVAVNQLSRNEFAAPRDVRTNPGSAF